MNSKLLILLFLILGLRFCSLYSNQYQFKDGEKIDFQTVILSQPQTVGSQQTYTANYKNQKIKISTNGDPEVNYGDYMRISEKIGNRNNGLLMYFPKAEVANNSVNIFQLSLGGINSKPKINTATPPLSFWIY